jgi:prepilin-type N-terminal cleavage/methylation domain-containing protein
MSDLRDRSLTSERGFTLPEVLVATLIIVIGLVAVATGFQIGTSGVDTGRTETTAVFLAQQRLEQLKVTAMTNYDGIAAGTTTEFCQTTDLPSSTSNCRSTAITGTTSYQRVTIVTDNPGGTGCTGVAPLL